jgi:hypothetical protein
MVLVCSGCFHDDPASQSAVRQQPPSTLRNIHRPSATGLYTPSPEADYTALDLQGFAFSNPDYVPDPQDLELPRVFAPNSAPHLISAQSPQALAVYGRGLGSDQSVQTKTAEQVKDIAGLMLNTSFESLFANVFNRKDVPAGKDDLPNPFADAKKSSGADSAQPSPSTPSPQQSQAPPAPKETPKPSTPPPQTDPGTNVSGGMISGTNSRFIFLGDFDGTGIVKLAYANRVGDAVFDFADAARTFVITENQGAVENQCSFAVEDMDGDGNMDLLQTARAGIFGAVMRGDGSGNFGFVDYFLTAYEPTVAVPGPMGDVGREIFSVDLRTASYTVFCTHGRYLPYRQGSLNFIPDYIAHILNLGTGLDYLLAAQTGNAPHLYQWLQGGSLSEAARSLPGSVSLSVSGDAKLDPGLGSLQVYQVGSYASVVATNSQGQAFNVANMRVTSQIFLVLGNIENRGTLDIGIAFLLSTVPHN